MDESEEDCN